MSVTEKDNSINVENNTSDVNWSITISGSGGYYNDSYCKAVVNGTTVFNETKGWGTGTFPAKDGTVSGTVTGIKHDDLGEKTISFSLEGYSFEYTVYSRSSTLTLSTIPRASTPSIPDPTVAKVLGNAITITTNRASSSFTHTIKIKDGSTTVETFTSVGASKSWTPSLANYASRITSGDTKTFTIECTTFNGNTELGTKTISVNLKVPDTVKPSVSIALARGDTTVPSTWGVYVKGKSKLAVTLTPTTSYGAAIKSYASSVESTPYTTATYTSNILQNAGTFNVTATVTDTREHVSAQASQQYTVVDYSGPSITTATCERCNSDGTANDEGTSIKYSFTGSISPVSNKNAKTFRIGYKLKTASSYTYVNVVTNAYTVNVSNVVLANVTFDATKSYDIIFEAVDTFTTTSVGRDIGTGFDLLNFNASGRSLAIGKMSETDDFELGLACRSTKTLGGSWIAMTRAASFKVSNASTANSGSFAQGFLSGKTKTGSWCIGALSGQDKLYLVWGSDTNYNNNTNTTNNWYINPDGSTNLIPSKLTPYPVGAIYLSTSSTSPASLFGGTWEQIQDKFLLAAGSTYSAGGTGGNATHTHTTADHKLTESEIPSHRHTATTKTTSYGSGSQSSWRCMSFDGTNADWSQTVYTGYTGGSGNHNHGNTGSSSSLPPYLVVYVWKRTA
jgi:hypothetical protein